ncbi:MAG TPA: hypothetical protein GX745_08140 [Clostridiales bacterium]|nr:hypothetical protein [Clostridiales bacterium]
MNKNWTGEMKEKQYETTAALICYEKADKTISVIYCEQGEDTFQTNTKNIAPILLKYYSNEKALKQLIGLGHLKKLGETPFLEEEYDEESSLCYPLREAEGENVEFNNIAELINYLGDKEFLLVFVWKEGKWNIITLDRRSTTGYDALPIEDYIEIQEDALSYSKFKEYLYENSKSKVINIFAEKAALQGYEKAWQFPLTGEIIEEITGKVEPSIKVVTRILKEYIEENKDRV